MKTTSFQQIQVYTEGRLIVEFTFDDIMRIRSWHFAVRNHRELIPRSILAMQEPGMVESLSKNVTRQGLTSTTLNYLRVCYDLNEFYIRVEHTQYHVLPKSLQISGNELVHIESLSG